MFHADATVMLPAAPGIHGLANISLLLNGTVPAVTCVGGWERFRLM